MRKLIVFLISLIFLFRAGAQPLTLNDMVFNRGGGGLAPPISASVLVVCSNYTAGTSITSSNLAPTANALQLVFISMQQNVTLNSISGNNLSWELEATQERAASNFKTYVYRAMGSAPTNGGITLTFSSAPTSRNVIMVAMEFKNVFSDGSNGRNAIVQNIYGALQPGRITGASPNTNALNTVVGMAANINSPASAVLQSGWTRDFEGTVVPGLANSMFVAHRLATTDSVFTNSMNVLPTHSYYMELRSANSAPYSLPPNTISNLVIWSRSDTGVYQETNATIAAVTNNAPIAFWENIGNTSFTNDFRQFTNTLRPVYKTTGAGGYPLISFNSNRLDMVMTSFSQPYTMAVIGTFTNYTDTNATWIRANGNSIQFCTASTATNNWFVSGGSGRFSSSGMVGTNGVPGVMIATIDTPTTGQFLWGNEVFTESTVSIGSTAVNTQFTVGGYINGGFSLIGDEYEVMFFSRALTTGEVSEIQRYAKFRYSPPY